MQITPEIVAGLGNDKIAQTLLMTAELINEFRKAGAPLSEVGPMCLMEAAERLKKLPATADKITLAYNKDLLEDLTKRIYEAVTPESVALGAEGLRKKLIAVMAAN